MIQQHLIPYSIHYAVPRQLTDDREPLIWHTTPGAFVFHTRIHCRFIPVSFVKHPSLNSFLGSLHLYSVISQVLTPPFVSDSYRICLIVSRRTLFVCHCVVILLNLKVVLVNSAGAGVRLSSVAFGQIVLCTSLVLLKKGTSVVRRIPCQHDFALISKSSQGPTRRGRCCCSEARARHV